MTDAEAELTSVYRQLLARAPENDIAPDLSRMQAICDLLGDPQHAAPVIHITGTNGKTSTARMVEALLRELNLRTGRFTSPHLTDVRERIALDGEPISAQRFVEVWRDIEPYVAMVDEQSLAAGGPRMTFFEVLTAMAFATFADAPVDAMILEVGMGGSWDATNVADGRVSIITPISRDHQQWLGASLTDIAGEKAGIIKDGASVVVANQSGLAQRAFDEETDAAVITDVLVAAAAARGARVLREGAELTVVDRTPAVGGQMMTLQTGAGVYEGIFLPLFGAHQAHNALLALAAVEQFIGAGQVLAGDVVEQGFANASSPGRLEVVRASPVVVVDAAHNAGGAEVLAAALDESFAFSTVVGVIGMLDDKDAEAFLSVLEPALAQVVITAPDSPRAISADDLGRIAVDVFDEDRVHVVDRLDDALDLAATLAEAGDGPVGGGVLVTGSIVLVAHTRILFGRP